MLLDLSAPSAPHLAVLGLLLGLVMCAALAAVTASFTRTGESAQVRRCRSCSSRCSAPACSSRWRCSPDRLASFCELLPLTPVITLVRGGWTGDLSAYEALGAVATAVAWTVVAVFAVRRWFRVEPRH